MSPDEFYSRAMRAADQSGRLPLSRMTGWEIFPFEPDGLTVVPLAPPELPEPPRKGEDREDCPVCTSDRPMVWSDEQWQLWPMSEETGAPLVLLLEPRAHYDLSNLPDERAAELGILQAHIARGGRGAAAHRAGARFALGRWRRSPARVLHRQAGGLPPASRHLHGDLERPTTGRARGSHQRGRGGGRRGGRPLLRRSGSVVRSHDHTVLSGA